jgi:hypothetical protein
MKRARQQAERADQRRRDEVQGIEGKIVALDESLENLTLQMEDCGSDAAKLLALSREYEDLSRERRDLYARWEELIR